MKKESAVNGLSRAIVFCSLTVFFFVVRLLPYGVYRVIAKGCVRLYYRTSGKLRRNAMESLTIAFGDRLSWEEKERISERSFFNLAEGIAGYLYGNVHSEHTRRTFIWEGREHLENALKAGKGAVIPVAHFGPFVWMMRAFIVEGYPTHVVMRPPRSLAVKDVFLKMAGGFGLDLICSVPLRACVTACFKVLERNELLFMPVDQNYGAAGRVFVDFFGRKAATAPGPIVYALKTDAPVLPAFVLPEQDGRFRIVIDPPMPIVSRGTERETVVHNTGVMTARVEQYVGQYPEQWSWMHRRWKAVPREGELS